MAKILKIFCEPDRILRAKSKEIKTSELEEKKISELFLSMAKTLKTADGLGIAAPQIGKNIRLVVINTKEGPVCLINPKLSKKSWAKEWGEEGCLSVPGTYGEVKRHKKLECDYINEKGEKKKILAQGMLARLIQHEVDHLDGILFIDKAKKLKKINAIPE